MNFFIQGKHTNKGATIAFLGLGIVAASYSAAGSVAVPESATVRVLVYEPEIHARYEVEQEARYETERYATIQE
jgi:hypothetical protein